MTKYLFFFFSEEQICEMKTFLEGVEGVEESFEMSDVDKRVAVVEVEQNEDSDEERVGVGEGNLPVEGERRILIAGSSHAAGLYPYFNPGYEVDTLSSWHLQVSLTISY